jgi:hypothetical protein
MAISDLRLALISFTESFLGFVGRGTKCVGLVDSAWAVHMEPVVLVKSESRACMGSVLLVSAGMAPYSPQCLVPATMTTLSEIVY